MGYLICPHRVHRINLFGELKGEKAAKRFNIPFLGVIIFDPEIVKMADKGHIEDYQSEAFIKVVTNF